MKKYCINLFLIVCSVCIFSFIGCSETQQELLTTVDTFVDGVMTDTTNVYLGEVLSLNSIKLKAGLNAADYKISWLKDGAFYSDKLEITYEPTKVEKVVFQLRVIKEDKVDVISTVVNVTEKNAAAIIGVLPSVIEVEKGENISINTVRALPTGKAIGQWQLEGSNISIPTGDVLRLNTETILPGNYTLKFNATYDGETVSKELPLKVVAPIVYPEYNATIIGYLSDASKYSTIKWDYITHLNIEVKVQSDGSLAMASLTPILPLIIDKARSKQVKVMLAITGDVKPVSSRGNTGLETFTDVLIDPVKNTKLLKSIEEALFLYKLNGIDLNYTDPDNWVDWPVETIQPYSDRLKKLIAEVKPLLTSKQTLTASIIPTKIKHSDAIKGYDFDYLIANLAWINVRFYSLNDYYPDFGIPENHAWDYVNNLSTYLGGINNPKNAHFLFAIALHAPQSQSNETPKEGVKTFVPLPEVFSRFPEASLETKVWPLGGSPAQFRTWIGDHEMISGLVKGRSEYLGFKKGVIMYSINQDDIRDDRKYSIVSYIGKELYPKTIK